MKAELKQIVYSFIVLIGLLSCNKAREEVQIEQPNVLFISLDDMNDWIEPLGGNGQSVTPNLSAFGNESVVFTKNYCASPGCNPSRSAILSGLHTYTSGMYSNYQDWRKVPQLAATKTLNQEFRQAGYFTAGAGKIYHYDQVDTLGWDEYFPSIKTPMPRDNFPEKRPANMPAFPYMYGMFDWAGLPISDEETGDNQSVKYIISQLEKEHDKPFFLGCGIYRPHLPWYVPQKYFDKFPLEQIQKPKILEGDTSDIGPVAKELISRGGNYHKHVVEADQWEKGIQGYLASVNFADEMVGRLLEALSQSAYVENTIVVIWSDHGWQLGEKNHWRKFALWENVNRSVLMIKVPKGVKALPEGSQSGETLNITSLLDIYPTLAELCGLEPEKQLDGQTLIPILKNPNFDFDRSAITTYDYGSYSIRYQNWHYIRYIDDSEELYDLIKDPDEWHNLADDQEYVAIKSQLQGIIPKEPIDLPEESLLSLQEHHVPPIRSKEYFFSQERKDWMKRFD